jgi:hypothetical protein
MPYLSAIGELLFFILADLWANDGRFCAARFKNVGGTLMVG